MKNNINLHSFISGTGNGKKSGRKKQWAPEEKREMTGRNYTSIRSIWEMWRFHFLLYGQFIYVHLPCNSPPPPPKKEDNVYLKVKSILGNF